MLRRIRGAMGARDAHFFTPGELRHMLRRAGLKPASLTGAIYFPLLCFIAALMSPLDAFFSQLGCFGAAFLIATGEKPSPEGG